MPSAEVSIEEEINQFQEEAHAAAMAELRRNLKRLKRNWRNLQTAESVSDVNQRRIRIAEVPSSESNKLVESEDGS